MYDSFNKTCMQNISWLNIRSFYFSFLFNVVSKRLIQYWHDQMIEMICWQTLIQFIFAAKMIETNAKTRKKIEKRRKSINMKKEISTWNLKLMQKISNILYNKLIDFFDKTKRIDFANMCCFEIFDFEFFKIWLIDDFWLIVNLK